jgi:hypothetical protein
METGDFHGASGATWWRAAGTLMADPAREERKKVILIAFVRNNSACILAGYPNRAVLPAAFSAQFTAMAGSLRWEETRTREIDRAAKLQLAEAEFGTLDPAVSEDGAGGAVGDIFSGLTVLDTSLQVQPGLAERWDVSPDGKTYTFHLRENARFHNGRSVTAEGVLFSWLRAAGPELGSETAVRYLGDIEGIRDYHERKKDFVSGLHVVDSRTIQATLDAPKNFFPQKLASPAAWIVDRYNVRLPHWEFNPNGTGPFRMAQYVPGKSILLEANPNYYGAPAKLKNVVYWLTDSEEEALFRSGKIDRMSVPESDLPRAGDPHDPLFGNVSMERKLCTFFLRFNAAAPPFDDPLVRKAFALSIDRDIYVEVTPEEGDLPGAGILPPGMPGYVSDSLDNVFDPQKAKELLFQSRYSAMRRRPRKSASYFQPGRWNTIRRWNSWSFHGKTPRGEGFHRRPLPGVVPEKGESRRQRSVCARKSLCRLSGSGKFLSLPVPWKLYGGGIRTPECEPRRLTGFRSRGIGLDPALGSVPPGGSNPIRRCAGDCAGLSGDAVFRLEGPRRWICFHTD